MSMTLDEINSGLKFDEDGESISSNRELIDIGYAGQSFFMGGLQQHEFKFVSEERGNIQPDTYYIVWEHEGKHYGLVGYYDSWNGVEFDDKNLVELTNRPTIVNNWRIVR